MGKLALAIAAVVIAAIGAVVVMAGRSSTGPTRQAASADPEGAVLASGARSVVGKVATVCGTVVQASTPQVKGRPTYLNFEARYPAQPFAAVIWQSHQRNFPSPPDQLYPGRRLCVTGQVTEYRGVPQMEIQSPSAVRVSGG